MPVQKLRRLGAPIALSLYDRMSMEALSCPYSAWELEALTTEHPNLIIERDGNVLGALSHGDAIVLAYAFENNRVFSDHFDEMFAKLLPRARKAYRADTVRFRLTNGPSRPMVEPVLRRLSFTPSRTWLQFSLEKGKKAPASSVPRGVTFRVGGLDDLGDALSIDRESFPNSPISREGMREELGQQSLLLAQRNGESVGLALYDHADADTAYLRTLAVREASRGQGVGAALTLRVAKAVFGDGATRLDLRTEDDNASAIRLYNWLGFKHVGSGRDYERPADPKVIERMRQQSEGTFIKFGNWR